MILFTFTEKIFLGKLYFLTLLQILFSDFLKKDLSMKSVADALITFTLCEKCPNTELFLIYIFPYSD